MEPVAKLSEKYQIMISDVDFTKRLKLSAAFNYFQQIAGLHADNLGIGFNTIQEKHNLAWVLTRMRVDITRYPLWDEEVTIETWPQLPRKYEFNRDYIMKDSQGNIIMSAISVWVILDIDTRRLRNSDMISIEYPPICTERAIDTHLAKLKPFGRPEVAYKRIIGCSDIDMNGHLNNSKYVDFIMDCFSMEQLRDYQAKSIQVSYLNEALPGDTIVLLKDNTRSELGNVYVEGIRESDNSVLFRSLIEI